MIKTAICVLSALALILGGAAAALWLAPAPDGALYHDTGFGLHEGRELVKLTDRQGRTHYVVRDGEGRQLFRVPVRDCLLDVRFRNGELRFRENATGRTGSIDRNGIVTFHSERTPTNHEEEVRQRADIHPEATPAPPSQTGTTASRTEKRAQATDRDALLDIAEGNPFYREAKKVTEGKLDEKDAGRRRVILNYCEHFRTAYTTKDIDFLRQLFSEQALIVVGHVVKPAPEGASGFVADGRVEYYLRTKGEYLERLSRAFAANRKIDVQFSDFRILRHPTMDGIYGVSLRQRYRSDRYADDGWLFLLWDFRDEAMPLIHVRTWQPADVVRDADDVITISDFNLK